MNPFITVLQKLYHTHYGYCWQGESGAAVCLLRAMALSYQEDDMGAGENPFRFVREQLQQFKPNTLIHKMEIDLDAECNR